MKNEYLNRYILPVTIIIISVLYAKIIVMANDSTEEMNGAKPKYFEEKTNLNIISNAGNHVYPYLASFLTYVIILMAFIAVCLYGPNLG